jgi:hypothetical protein
VLSSAISSPVDDVQAGVLHGQPKASPTPELKIGYRSMARKMERAEGIELSSSAGKLLLYH